ncbi:MAG: TrmB family transcriptional regulator [Candidatus Bathyarchaeia archaeon]
MENRSRLAEILNKELDLTPYESRAYIALITYGPMSPSELARKSSIPRPRTYDVLRSLMERGLLMEQSGKPSIYAPIAPTQGLQNLLIDIEMETLKKLDAKRRAIQMLSKALLHAYEKSKNLKLETSKVWFTRRDTAFVALYSESIRNCEKEIIVSSTSLRPPEKEVLEAVKHALKKGRSVRVVRSITKSWTLDELDDYESVIKAGSQVRFLNDEEITIRFSIFDKRDIILVLPSESGLATPQIVEALWLSIPSLARILSEHFEELWRKGKPMLPIIKKIRKEKRHN